MTPKRSKKRCSLGMRILRITTRRPRPHHLTLSPNGENSMFIAVAIVSPSQTTTAPGSYIETCRMLQQHLQSHILSGMSKTFEHFPFPLMTILFFAKIANVEFLFKQKCSKVFDATRHRKKNQNGHHGGNVCEMDF